MGRAHKDNHSNSRLTFTTKVVQVEHLAQPLSLTKSSVHVSYLLLTLLLSLASPKIGRTLTSKSSQFKGKDKNKTKRVTRQIKQEVSPSSFSSRQVLLVSRKRDSLDLAQLGKVPKSITWSQKVRTIRNWKRKPGRIKALGLLSTISPSPRLNVLPSCILLSYNAASLAQSL